MTGEDIRKAVTTWMEENRFLANNARWAWRHRLADRLAKSVDMRPAWNELAKRGGHGTSILGVVFSCVEASIKECKRLPQSKEDERTEDVRRALENLRKAIEKAPSPAFDSMDLSLAINETQIGFSWRSSGDFADSFGILPVCLDDLLEQAQQQLSRLASKQPARTVARKRAAPELAAFIRHLAAEFQQQYGDKLMGTVARIATATYNLPDQVTKEQVERILRPSPNKARKYGATGSRAA